MDGLSTYSWQDADPNQILQKILAGQNLQTALGATVGAQSAQQLYSYVSSKLMPAFESYYQQQAQQLNGVNPAFNPKNYALSTNLMVGTHGEGASANRVAPLNDAVADIQTRMIGIQNAQQAAQNYQRTGVIAPYPSLDSLVKQTVGKIWSGTNLSSADIAYLSKKATSGVSEADKATANAAAARIGAPLPYPGGSIGQIAGGGVFQTPEEAMKAYSNGQLNTYGQNVLNSSSYRNVTKDTIYAMPNGQFSWNGQTYPTKDAAVMAANKAGVQSAKISNSPPPVTGSYGTGGTGGGVSGSSGGVNASSGSTQAALDYINKLDLDPGIKALFAEAVQGWDPSKEVSHKNIIDKFNQIKKETIDPYFEQKANVFIDSIKRTQGYLSSNRDLELEQEGQAANQNIQNAQNNLEARGLTFSGEATDQLGKQSAYGMTGEAPNSSIPTQSRFYQFGQRGEGMVQAQNRMMSTSSAARYQNNLTDLSRQAEQTLGSIKSQGLVPGATQMGNISGSLDQEKNQQEASTLSNLYSQSQDNYSQNKQINLFS